MSAYVNKKCDEWGNIVLGFHGFGTTDGYWLNLNDAKRLRDDLDRAIRDYEKEPE